MENILHSLKGVKALLHSGVTWLDVESPDAAVFSALEKDYGLHPVHLQESVQKVQLTQIDHEKGYLFLLLHIPHYDKTEDKLVAAQIGVFLGKNYVITIHNGINTPAKTMFIECGRDSHAREDCFKKGSGYLLYSLVRKLLDDLSVQSQSLLDELDTLEDRVFDDNGSDAYQIGRLRQKIIRLKRLVGSMRPVLQDLAEQINSFSGEGLAHHYANNTKTANKLGEILGEAQETIEIFKDADFTISTEKTNETLAVLTLLFTLTIPATVIGAMYGMNVTLPGGITTGSWTFLGPYTMLKLIVGASLLVALAMYVYFKRKKWF